MVIWDTGYPGSPRQFLRTVEMTSPNGNVTYTLYDDVNHAVFTFSGVTETVDGSGDGILTTTGPISMTRTQVPYTYSYHGGTVAGTYDETMTGHDRVRLKMVRYLIKLRLPFARMLWVWMHRYLPVKTICSAVSFERIHFQQPFRIV
jgi:hypothetical protein